MTTKVLDHPYILIEVTEDKENEHERKLTSNIPKHEIANELAHLIASQGLGTDFIGKVFTLEIANRLKANEYVQQYIEDVFIRLNRVRKGVEILQKSTDRTNVN